jgi:phosphoribosylformimino-5-aminoimidazole carboxamide ribotide isomerase
VVIGTKAAQDVAFLRSILETHGERIVLGLDARDGKVAVGGWLEVTSRPATDLAREAWEMGAVEAVCTDIATDGAMTGPNLAGLREMGGTGLGVIASGGLRSVADLEAVAQIPGVVGAIVGKAIYTGDFDLEKAVEMEAKDAG